MKYLDNRRCKKHGKSIIQYKLRDPNTNKETEVRKCIICWKFEIFDKIGYKCHPSVKRFHESLAPVRICSCPARSSKSYSAGKDVLPNCLTPDTVNWAVGGVLELANKEFQEVFKDLVVNRDRLGLEAPVSYSTNVSSGNLYIKWSWGTIFQGKTSLIPDKSLLGDRLHSLIMSEGSRQPEGIMKIYLEPRLRASHGTAIIPSTPYFGAQWMYEMYLKGYEAKWQHRYQSFKWGVEANPEYPLEELEEARLEYGEDDPYFREQYLGEWVFYAGSVYGTFDEDIHVIEPFEIPKHWRVIRCVDFGTQHPFAVLWVAVGPSNELYCIREYYHTTGQRSMEVHAEIIKEHSKNDNTYMSLADPEAPQSIIDLRRYGVYCNPAKKAIIAGRQHVLDYMTLTPDAPAPHGQEKEKDKSYPRLYVFNNLENLKREIKFHRYRGMTGRQGEKETTEGDDHLLDDLRYICMTRPSPFSFKSILPVNTFSYYRNKMTQNRILKSMRRLGR